MIKLAFTNTPVQAIIPLYWEHSSWATRKSVRYEGGVEQWNVATSAFVAR